MIRNLAATVVLIFITNALFAQLKVAAYAIGKRGTDAYEHLSFWTKDGKRSAITYSFGRNDKELKLSYAGLVKQKGNAYFVVRFPNKYELFVYFSKNQLRVTDAAGKYNKLFSWEYEGPVNGIGTFCAVCAEDENDAMAIMQNAYFE